MMKTIFQMNRLKCLFKSWKALWLYAFGNAEKAIFELENCLMLDPRNGPNLRTLGTILIHRGRYLEGITKLKEALQCLPASDKSIPETFAYTAYAYSELDRIDESLKFYKRALSSWIKDGDFKKIDMFYNIGRIYLQKQNYSEAMRLFQKGLEVDDKEARIHFGLGIAYYEVGKEKDCLHHFQIAINLDPTLKEDDTMKHICKGLGYDITVH